MERGFRRYDNTGLAVGYSLTRRPDPQISAQIEAAMGGAWTVLNVGAGTGSYEPTDRRVVALEPSIEMIRQRSEAAAPVVQGVAEALPFIDDSFDVVTALWTIHHWSNVDRACKELERVARRIVIVLGSVTLNDLWITRDYFPEMARIRRPDIQPERVASHFDSAQIGVVPIRRDCADGFCEAFWGRPEALLDERVRAGTSTFKALSAHQLSDGLLRLETDLRDGTWDRRHGSLRELSEYDCGVRIIIAERVL